MDVLRTSISNFAARCAEKLRKHGSQQYTKPGGKGKADVFKDSIKHNFRSPCYTTRWSDIPEAE